MWHGGSAPTSLLRADFEQLHDRLIANRHLTEQELQQGLAALNDPNFMTPSPVLWTVSGRKPSADCDNSAISIFVQTAVPVFTRQPSDAAFAEIRCNG
jgi:hypothetical protein